MAIETHTPELNDHRRTLMQMLAWRYPAAAVEQFPDKPFHRVLRAYGLVGDARGVADTERCDHSHPYLAVDMSRCIDCSRCVRICNDVQGQRVWHVRERGLETSVVPDGPSLRESSCVGCGACVDTCPTGALEDAGASPLLMPSQWTRTTCPYCGVGCEMHVGTRDARLVAVRPALDAPVNKGHLCVKGRYAFGFVHADDRITQPLIRERDRWRRASWTEARAFVASRLQDLVDRYGPRQYRRARLGAGDERRQLRGPEVRADRHRHEQRRLLRAGVPCAQRRGTQTGARGRPGDEFVRRHRACPNDPGVRRQRHRRSSRRRRTHPTGRASRCAVDCHRSTAD